MKKCKIQINDEVKRFIKYAIVGAIATLFDWSTMYIITELGINYKISVIISFIIGLIVNFILSKIFIFKKSIKAGKIIEFTYYLIIGLIGLGINELIMILLTEGLKTWYMYSRMVATCIVLFWNYGARVILYKFK